MRLQFALPMFCCASLLAGCADLAPYFASTPGQSHPRAEAVLAQSSAPAPAPAPAADPQALREAIRLYENGDYNAAIRRLSSPDVANGPLRMRVTALKYMAFSYCVTNRAAQCQQAFEKALKLDPQFDLAPGEHGHPLWGPVFAKARNAR